VKRRERNTQRRRRRKIKKKELHFRSRKGEGLLKGVGEERCKESEKHDPAITKTKRELLFHRAMNREGRSTRDFS